MHKILMLYKGMNFYNCSKSNLNFKYRNIFQLVNVIKLTLTCFNGLTINSINNNKKLTAYCPLPIKISLTYEIESMPCTFDQPRLLRKFNQSLSVFLPEEIHHSLLKEKVKCWGAGWNSNQQKTMRENRSMNVLTFLSLMKWNHCCWHCYLRLWSKIFGAGPA